MAHLFVGSIISTSSLNDFLAIPKGFLAVDANGKIAGIGTNLEEWRAINTNFVDAKEVHLSAEQFLMPGLVDCHIHAPQVAQIGLGLDMPLLEWLNTYTFPLEAKFADQAFASAVYSRVVESTIKCGTTLASYFGTNSKDSTIILAKEAARQGQRALVGKVCSNCHCPDFYIETTEDSIRETREFIDGIKALETDLVQPTVTPRFALSCSKELLTQLGEIARQHNLHIQSHISESVAEVELVKSIFGTKYAEAYDNAGLLTRKTIMAHAVHLDDDEIALLKARGTAVAHCPASNTMLSSGFCDILRLIANGVKVGLGTDVSGGNSISIQDAILRALDVSHHLEFVKKHDIKGSTINRLSSAGDTNTRYTPLNYKQAIYLATLGGAEALAMEAVTGNFAVGKDFDALLIDTSIYPLYNYDGHNLDKNHSMTTELKLLEMVQKFIYVGDDRNIVNVFVSGKRIKA